MRVVNTFINAEPQIQSIRLITEPHENIPQPQRILAARNGDQDLFVMFEHLIFLDKAFGLFGNPFQIMFLT